MIPITDIRAWGNVVPWKNDEQVEVNCREHFSVLGYLESSYSVDTRWFSGTGAIQTYKLEELLATKLRALYQRKKGRDLYDLYKAIIVSSPDPGEVLSCYKSYMDFSKVISPTRKQFVNNLKEKLRDNVFIGDTSSLLRPGENYDAQEAFNVVNETLLEKL